MAGAVVTNLTVLQDSPGLPMLLLVLAALVAHLRRAQPKTLG